MSEKKENKKYIIENKINDILNELGENIPFRFNRPEGTSQIIILSIMDLENKIISPYILGSDSTNHPKYILSLPSISDFIIDILERLKIDGEITNPENIARIVLNYVTNSQHSQKYLIKDFSTFSMDKNIWKISYIDPDKIASARKQKNDIPAWQNFEKSFDSPEGWNLFCAWFFGCFQAKCYNTNRQALWIYGPGGNGKSTVTRVLQYIISGKFENTYGSSTLGMEQLETQFWASSVYGRSLTIIPESTDQNLLNGKNKSKMHAWLGGDNVSVEFKGKTPIFISLKARCLICSNLSPTFDTAHINNTTRLIPIALSGSYYTSTPWVGDKTWEETLFDERYRFLAYCYDKFTEKFNQHNLFDISKEYKEIYFEKSQKANNLEDIGSFVTSGTKIYNNADMIKYCKFVAKNLLGLREDPQSTDICAILRKKDIKQKNRQPIGRYYECNLDEDIIKQHNNDIDEHHRPESNKIYERHLNGSVIIKDEEPNDFMSALLSVGKKSSKTNKLIDIDKDEE